MHEIVKTSTQHAVKQEAQGNMFGKKGGEDLNQEGEGRGFFGWGQ